MGRGGGWSLSLSNIAALPSRSDPPSDAAVQPAGGIDAPSQPDASVSARYLDGEYLSANPDWHTEDAPWKIRQVAAILDRNGIVPRSVCDIGCGSGACIELMSRRVDGDAVGYDISPDAFAIARLREAGRLRFVNGSPLGGGHVYDLALVLDVVEHVEDPFAFVRSAAAASVHQVFHIPLDMNALAVLRGWPLRDARRTLGHLSYFDRNSALAMLRECGLTIVDERYTPWALERPSGSLSRTLAKLPRRALHALSPHLAARALGGWALMVLTRSGGTSV